MVFDALVVLRARHEMVPTAARASEAHRTIKHRLLIVRPVLRFLHPSLRLVVVGHGGTSWQTPKAARTNSVDVLHGGEADERQWHPIFEKLCAGVLARVRLTIRASDHADLPACQAALIEGERRASVVVRKRLWIFGVRQ
jgi:hypothetical protein